MDYGMSWCLFNVFDREIKKNTILYVQMCGV